MDYEKLYKESLDRAKNIYGASESKDILSTLTTIFPELRQNEDDKIREALIDGLYDCMSDDLGWSDFGGMPIEDLLDWLEKQDKSKFEQCIQEGDNIVTNEDGTHFNISQLERVAKKESSWSEEDELTRNALLNLVEMYYGECINKEEKNRLLDWLKSLKERIHPQQKQEWSEEDEKRLKSCLNILQAKGLMGVTETINTKWLKSLKERMKGE